MLLLFLLYVIHSVIMVFVAFGFLLQPNYLIYYVFAWPIMILHWTTNNNMCILTQLENRLNNLGKEFDKTVYEFYSHLLMISPEQVRTIFVYGCTFLWTIAVIRLFISTFKKG
jgi:hypothetical protein